MKHGGGLGLIAPIAWFGALCAPAIGTATSNHGALALLFFGGLYLALGMALHAALALGAGAPRLIRLATVVAAGAALTFHLREVARWPASSVGAMALTAALAGATGWIYRRSEGAADHSAGRRRRLATFGLAAAAAAGLLAIAVGNGPLRWLLLRQHPSLGNPVGRLLLEPTDEVEAELLDRHLVPEGTEVPAAPVGTTPAPAPEGDDPPDLVLLLIDTLRADALAPWRRDGDGDGGSMPALDRELQSAFVFRDVLASSSWTLPSVATFLTGLLPEQHGARSPGHRVPEDLELLPELLGARGYQTAAFVTNPTAGEAAGFRQGYDVFDELEAEPYARAERLQRRALAWVREQRDPARPLFLYLHYLDPHEPYLAGSSPTGPRAGAYERAYAAELAYLDGQLAALWHPLAELLRADHRIVLVSDHGEELFDHGRFGHGLTLYEEVVRIPLAVFGEGSGSTEAALDGRDVYGLLLHLATGGGDLHRWAADRSRTLRPLSTHYHGFGRLWLRPWRSNALAHAVVTGSEKLIWTGYGRTRELYDVTADPGERENLVTRRPGRATELEQDLWASLAGPWHPGEEAERSAEELDRLRKLGYAP